MTMSTQSFKSCPHCGVDVHVARRRCVCGCIDNRPTEKGLETRNFLAISHSGARYDHVI